MKRNIVFILIFLAIVAGGAMLQQLYVFETAVNTLQNRQLPSTLLNFGRMGQILKNMGLPYITPAEEEIVIHDPRQLPLNLTNLHIREEWFEADNLPPEKMASTVVMDKDAIMSGLPIISMYMNHYDLYDEFTGIYANPLERGRNWERPCFVSYFDNGKLLFGTGAGARIHGQTSRLHALKNFRLHFRSVYGQDSFRERTLFEGDGDPIRSLVIKKADERYGFIESMAYAIARKAGCYAPNIQPVRLFLNGKPHGHGNFQIIEHLTRDYLKAHFGHSDFIFYKVKGEDPMPPEYEELYDWAHFSKRKITYENAAKMIDIDNFIKIWIVNILCGNSDPYQGFALRDNTKENSKWFWLMWDMDHSFRNIYEPQRKHIWKQERPINLVYSDRKDETDPRYFIFRKLIFDDEQFRDAFKKRMEIMLNHVLTTQYLLGVVDTYITTARSFGMDMTLAEQQLREYMKMRPEFSMNMMNRYFALGEVQKVFFEIPAGRSVLIDGYEMKNNFTGLYFKGSEVVLSGKQGTVKGWAVNGKRYNRGTVTINVNESMKVTALF